jgi:glycogen operon protein
MMACLLLAQGVPLVLAGDEVGNSQNGNNNAYCQDNPIGWVDWGGLGHPDYDLSELVKRCTELRAKFPQLRTRKWVDGPGPDGSYGVLWLTPTGTEMTHEEWIAPELCFLSYLLAAEEKADPLYIVLNAGSEPITFTLPIQHKGRWRPLLNTAALAEQHSDIDAGGPGHAEAGSVLVFAGIA